ncbi:MAG: patatin-like phospholipase family protein [Cellulosilyticaceae bacterium]
MKIGLVLSGGGGKGAYELGVWLALEKLGLTPYIKVFAGTSIGAINAALFAQGDLDAAFGMWQEVTIDKLIPISKLKLLQKGIGVAIGGKVIQINKKYLNQKLMEGSVSKAGAIEIINKYVDLDKVKSNEHICYAACTQVPELEARYFRITDYPTNLGKEMIIASACLPHIYDCAEVLGRKFVDGGIVDNTPIKPVYKEGCDVIIVVSLSRSTCVNRRLYSNLPIIEIIPRQMIGNTITGTLNLDYEAKKLRIKQGYYDTIDQIEPVMKLTQLLPPGEAIISKKSEFATEIEEGREDI